MKSICVKTNNELLRTYLLKNIKHAKLDDCIFSCYKFKIFYNIIIHYLGKEEEQFLDAISDFLANAVIDIYENKIINNIIKSSYYFFSDMEKEIITKKCVDEIKLETSASRIELIKDSFYRYFTDNKSVNFDGFIDFRIQKYREFLDSLIDIIVNKYIIDKEYLEFINLLRTYINTKPIGANILYLVYTNQSSTILDENKQKVETTGEIFKHAYLSDISFSSNDYALNILLTTIPKKLIIYTETEDDEFINTLKLIFENRVIISKEHKALK